MILLAVSSACFLVLAVLGQIAHRRNWNSEEIYFSLALAPAIAINYSIFLL